ncbi:16S rRNA (cytidine(1402)-2'-O)-methyltransferase [Candidatus Albibeggiatoa sp. nov. NOAA]|uniref:16S rRNA (cytidine(1402)-2'-O)-methyltransferase n=1 Tax=Candidatus Albibeggiatoa sp. nov. NOAA TaxID=3162724 RepID=UPI0032F3BCCA|nr:16S rRNA (cytidine(1402)-2'-O)-methyltransferase [Thiotrichaceae bacterium]
MSAVGILYVVATPIGNLQDFSPRAQSILKTVDLIAAEDTRHTKGLLNHFAIPTALQSLHEHNEKQIAPQLIQRLQQGENIALVSDAGTPLISDPGHYLVRLAHEAGITISPIPGASALISALSVSGLRADRFRFEGFLPPKSHARQQVLKALVSQSHTLAFYEAPHRIEDSIADMVNIFGEQRIGVLVKELSKVFETVKRGQLGDLLAWLQADAVHQKGEFVIIIEGIDDSIQPEIDAETMQLLDILLQELPLKKAAKLASQITGISKNKLYQSMLDKQND